MTACSFNIFIIFTIYLSFIFHPSHGFEVIQPRNRTVNPDGSVSISCEHTANTNSVIDVRLYGIYRGSEAMNSTYQCEFTVKKDDLDSTKSGNPTILLPGQKEVVCVRPPPPPNPPPPPPPPPPPLWILIGLLALMFLYSCVITFFYIRLRYNNKDPENSTYVEMRNVPRPRNRPFNINCG
ncbi:junction-mediating and -regulatory protein-like isoform X2 [Siniperca chuatsi]|uniref:junction-mediating and -regulatory protein-like isoform X2 n=1 Tax=Siniperca chuatsi TaxID=119488 RepID=UPI001CE12ACA|nr:junction-mediating and -regulatory protein-like isoform X2 [Siniperca chuatsi]